jgi:hypothetical protein
MAVARFAVNKPAANTDHLLFTIERTALTSLVAVNTSGFTNISAWIVPAGEDANPENWIYYVDTVGLTNRNSFETFRIAVNVDDKIYVRSTSGEVTFFINGIYDVAGRANVTTGPTEPESPQIGDVWINEAADPRQIYYWDGSEWMPLGTTGLSNVLTIGTVDTGDFGDPAEVTITGDSPEQVLNFVLPMGEQGPGNTLTVGTVEASEPGEDAEVEITGTSPDQTINFVLPRGDIGPANTLTVGTVEASDPGEDPEVEITGTAPDQTIDFVLPRGEVGPPNVLTVGTVTTSDPGDDAEVEITGTAPDQTINFVLPRGDVGPEGPMGPIDLPDQTSNAGKYLTTDGTDPSWATVDALPSQTGNEGKYLTTDGTDPEWAFLSGGSAANEPPATGLVDGSIWLDTDGTIQPASVDLTRWTKIAIAAQDTFTGEAEGGGATLTYVPGNEQVFLNGVQLVRGSDYTADSGTGIVLASAASVGDIFQVLTLPPVAIVDAVTKNLYDAKGDIITATAADTPIKIAVGTTGQYLMANSATATGLEWTDVDALPDQDTNAGKFLTTDGTDASWEEINLQPVEDNLVLTLMGAI